MVDRRRLLQPSTVPSAAAVERRPGNHGFRRRHREHDSDRTLKHGPDRIRRIATVIAALSCWPPRHRLHSGDNCELLALAEWWPRWSPALAYRASVLRC